MIRDDRFPILTSADGGGPFRLAASGLALTFVRSGDRWIHTLSLSQGEIAASVESDLGLCVATDPGRVISPAYQDVQAHVLDEAPCLLLTGQATPHHFSSVVTCRTAPGACETVFDWDIADRCRASIEVLAATYLVPFGSSALVDAGPERIVWSVEALAMGPAGSPSRPVLEP